MGTLDRTAVRKRRLTMKFGFAFAILLALIINICQACLTHKGSDITKKRCCPWYPNITNIYHPHIMSFDQLDYCKILCPQEPWKNGAGSFKINVYITTSLLFMCYIINSYKHLKKSFDEN